VSVCASGILGLSYRSCASDTQLLSKISTCIFDRLISGINNPGFLYGTAVNKVRCLFRLFIAIPCFCRGVCMMSVLTILPAFFLRSKGLNSLGIREIKLNIEYTTVGLMVIF